MNQPVIDISDLSKYYGKNRGIEHVNLQVKEGEIFGFMGPNGAGKSTTIRILLNLIFPTRGTAKIMGMDVISQSKQIKRLVGYIPSDANAYASMKVQEFLSYCMRFHQAKEDSQRMNELASRFELDLKRKVSELSMGNRKKVSIIQSILHRPKLLILDEPTTGLDPLMQSRFFELLTSENKQGMTVFFSSHILNEVQMLCKQVAIIKEGRIIQQEDIDTLRKKQLKKVHIVFEDQPVAESFNISGLEQILNRMDHKLSFMFSGNINELVQHLSAQKISNLIIEEPSLEEIFMHFYQ
jgi:ABC-2 type transport system ATP-binding protein